MTERTIYEHPAFEVLIPYLTQEEIDSYDPNDYAKIWRRGRDRYLAAITDHGGSLTGQHGKHPRGTNHYAAKLTPDIVRLIRSGHYKTDAEAAKMLGVHWQTIGNIRRRTTYTNIA